MSAEPIDERTRVRDELYRLLGELRDLSTAPASSEAYELAARAVDPMVSDEGNPRAVLRAYLSLGAPPTITIPQLAKALDRERSSLHRSLMRMLRKDRAEGKGTWMFDVPGEGEIRKHRRVNLTVLAAEHPELFAAPPELAPAAREFISAEVKKEIAGVEADVRRREVAVFAALRRRGLVSGQ